MVSHLRSKISFLESKSTLSPGDVVIDIGSNDCTTLKSYETQSLRRIGIDPTGVKFQSYYPDDIELITDFFPCEDLSKTLRGSKAKIITSIAMFYDLDNPIKFAQEVSNHLDKFGIWYLEQSYMPSMLRYNSYDTICHEHYEYYSLQNIIDILKQAELKVIDVQLNSVNGEVLL